MSSKGIKPPKSNKLNITRRDFVNGALVGSGAVMLNGCLTPVGGSLTALSKAQGTEGTTSVDPWTGPGGIGDYANANGNTLRVRQAAHAVRDKNLTANVWDAGEEYDLVVVGGGFAGMSAAYTYQKKTGFNSKVLVLDNHAMFGGAAKLNEFEVDGYRMMAPQGSDVFLRPTPLARQAGMVQKYWDELGLPKTQEDLDKVLIQKKLEGTDKPLTAESGHFLTSSPNKPAQGYFFKDPISGSYNLVRGPEKNHWKDCPISEKFRADWIAINDDANGPIPYEGDDWLDWLDSITYKDYIEKVLELDPEVTKWVEPKLAYSGGGLGAEVCSARLAFLYEMPGVKRFYRKLVGDLGLSSDEKIDIDSVFSQIKPQMFPGGNSCILRHFVKKLNPAAISGGDNLNDILNGSVNFRKLDRRSNKTRIRLSSMVSEVVHEGDVDGAESLTVTYMNVDSQKMYRVRARGVVCAAPAMINKRILKDVPKPLFDAMDHYAHAPLLAVNVALRNWRFMERKGVTSARYFGGKFGWYLNLRHGLKVGDYDEPWDPNKPVVLTIYKSFEDRGPGSEKLTGKQKATMARAELLSKSYADYEEEILQQLTDLFGDSGFDAEKDVAAITLNRWGHDFVVVEPGFWVGKDGTEESGVPATIKRGYGLVGIAHTELEGRQTWMGGADQGERAAKQVLLKQQQQAGFKTVEGDWRDSASNSVVRISIENGVAIGKVIEVDEKMTEVDRQRILGLRIISGLTEKGSKWTGGTILDPATDTEYGCQLSLESNDELAVKAYIGNPLFGQNFVWTRVKGQVSL